MFLKQSTSVPFLTKEQWIEYQISISNNPDAITDTSVDFDYTNKQYKNHMVQTPVKLFHNIMNCRKL